MTCRLPTCDGDARGRSEGRDGFAAAFCSTRCELKYEHIQADARDARRARARERHTDTETEV
jgi:hypothetical protein